MKRRVLALALALFMVACLAPMNLSSAKAEAGYNVEVGTANFDSATSTVTFPNAEVTASGSIYTITVQVSTGMIASTQSDIDTATYGSFQVFADNKSDGAHKTETWYFSSGLTAAKTQSFIRALEFKGYESGMDITVSIDGNGTSLPSGATLTLDNTNDGPHYYAYIASSNVTWKGAYAAAKSMTFNGMKGYLATITSSAEDAILDQISSAGAWGGGARVNASATTFDAASADGYSCPASSYTTWYWMCGPEAGSAFSYTHWNSGEPNNSGSKEWNLQLHHSTQHNWNDLAGSADSSVSGYFVEFSKYGTTSDGGYASGYEDGKTSSSTVQLVNIENQPQYFVVADIPAYDYTGSEIKPAVVVTSNGKTLTEGEDYEITGYADNVNAGTASVTVKGLGNFFDEVTVNFTINKLTPVLTVDTDPITYGEKLSAALGSGSVAYYNNAEVAGTIAFANGDAIIPTVADSNTTVYTVNFTPTDTTNYNSVSKKVTIKVNKADQYVPDTVSKTDETYTDKADGAITGVTDKMEYRVNPNGEWTSVPTGATSITGLEPGLYDVRVKSDANHKQSATQTLQVLAGRNAVVSLASDDCDEDGYTLSVSKNSCVYNEEITVTYELNEGYSETATPVVTLNGTALVFTEGSCTVNITEDSVITAHGIKDITAPTGTIEIAEKDWQEFLSNITFGLFYKDAKVVTITAEDAGSGVATIEYYRTDAVYTEAEVSAINDWNLYSAPVTETVVDAEQFVYYVKLTDNAGNVRYICSDGSEFDVTAPVISGISDGAVYYTTQIFEADDRNIDTVTVNGARKAVPFKVNGNTDAEYVIVVTDKAGNETTYTVTMKTIASLSEPMDEIEDSNVKSSDTDTIEDVLAAVNAVDTEDATESEKQALDSIKDECEALLQKIEETAEALEAAENAADSYETATVKTTDEEAVQQAKEAAEAISDDNLTEEEKAAKQAAIDKYDELLDQIAEVKDALETADEVNDALDEETVNSDSREAIEDAKEALEALSDDNLTEEEKQQRDEAIEALDEFIETLDEAQETLENIAGKLDEFDLENVTSADEEAILEAMDEAVMIDRSNLTEEEQQALDDMIEAYGELLEKIDEVNNEIEETKAAIENLDLEDVDPSDKEDLEEALEKAEAIDRDNLTEEEAEALDEQIEKIEEMIDRIETVEEIEEALEGVDTVFGIELDSDEDVQKAAEMIADLLDRLEEYNGSEDTPANEAITSVLGEDGYVAVTLKNIKVVKNDDEDSLTFVFDVCAYKDGEQVHKLDKAITFRLPVTETGFKYVNVYHEGELLGQYEVKNGYVEVSSAEFSEYSYTLTNTKYTVPQTGDDTHMVVWMLLLAASLMGVCALSLRKKSVKG